MSEEMKSCPFCGEQILAVAIKCRYCGSMLNGQHSRTTIIDAFSSEYEILEEIGRGGMATVYKARQKNLNRIVALKVVPKQFTHDKDFVARFKREAQHAAKLNHPNLITIYDVGEMGGYPYMSMEYLEGGTLSQKLHHYGAINEKEIKKIMLLILDGLGYAHQKGIVHRDIKSSNIMFDEKMRPVLMDFGIAKSSEGTKLTKTGTIIGTPEYMSPEQADADRELDHRTDIYSMGIVLYEIATGKVPFGGGNPITVLHDVVHKYPTNPIEINASLSPGFANTILKAVSKNPDDRYQSCDGFAIALKQGENSTNNRAYKYKKKQTKQTFSPQPAKSKGAGLKIAIGIVSIIIIAIAAYLGIRMFPSNVQIPDVVGMQYIDAVEVLKQNGLSPKQGETIKTKIEKTDKVKDQLPRSGEVKKHTKIVLDVYQKWVDVPDVVNRSEEKARSLLQSSTFKVASTISEFHPIVPQGKVIEISGEPGELPEGSEVTIVLSKGIEMVSLPSVIGLGYSLAKNKLEQVGLKARKGSTTKSYSQPTNTVSMISPSDNQIPKGSTLTLDVFEKWIKVPTVIGLNKESAKQKLQNLGISVNKFIEKFSSKEKEIVLKCNKTEIKEGGSVNLTVSKVIFPGMVFVEGGTFHMGSYEASDEQPVHTVVAKDFFIGKYEVTQKEWKEVMNNNPSYFKGDDLPVEKVSWYGAVEFCNKKSDIEGLTRCYSGSGNNIKCNFNANGYRLPTEAEWEYACRGGSQTARYKYSGSNSIGEVAWYNNNSNSNTHKTGTKKANELGIYDMSGNVWEWCNDWYDSSYYSSSQVSNPTGPDSGSYRVLRGGNCGGYIDGCRVAGRSYDDPGSSYNYPGFRIARPVE